MNKENIDFLHNEFSFMKNIYPETHDGWYRLIYNLCLDISKLDLPKDFKVQQVKEKFAGLRFYTNLVEPEDVFDELNKLIQEAEAQSLKTCEYCANPGTQVSVGGFWIHTFCKDCEIKEREYRQQLKEQRDGQ